MNRSLKIFCLVFFFGLCGVAIYGTHLTRQATPPPAAHELFAVVNRQLSAFRAADYPLAYRSAASVVQQQFSVPQFELMVRRDYSPMTEAQRVEFGAIQVAGPSALVQVFLTTRDGSIRGYLYSFTAEPDGWKINGVQPLGPTSPRRLPEERA
jgi:hypothetical protein